MTSSCNSHYGLTCTRCKNAQIPDLPTGTLCWDCALSPDLATDAPGPVDHEREHAAAGARDLAGGGHRAHTEETDA